MKQIRKHVTYANVMSSLAVFMVLGGATAVAATKIGANEIKANSIKTGKIVKEAVTAGKIKNAAVGESKLADGAVTTAKLADLAVTAPKLANNAVNTGKIAGEAVTTGKIANDAVNSGKIDNGAVNSNKLANEAVTAAKLALGERSQVLVNSATSEINLPEEYGQPNDWATVLTLPVPAGNWVLNAHVQLAIGTADPGSKVVCRMTQNNNVLSQSGTQGSNNLIPAIDGIDLLATTTAAGQVTVTCADSAAGVGAFARTLIAQRVGSIE